MKKNGFEKVSIEHVLQMTSGIAFNESYWNPTGEAAKFYYGNELEKYTLNLKLKQQPGLSFDYVSGNTQLLGLLLQRALKTKTITQYLNEKIWQPLGMEFAASWSLDKEQDGIEKTFCCLNARARDFAKIGTLMLHEGNWKGKQLIPKDWIKQSTKVDTTKGSAWYYQHQWWLTSTEGDYMAHGILGQYIYINPMKNIVIVRLGKNEGKVSWSDVFREIANGIGNE
jgi:CubicO group peptidase (beta-lactamase class C family)